MKIITILLVGLLASSCAKVQYVFEQGVGQLKLLSSAKPNEKVLQSGKLKESERKKIELIGTYKDFFYRFFSKEKSKIYDRTVLLDRDAVSYLVIASPWNEIKAREECFLIVGCFPYLGFFKLESAKEFAKDLEKKDFQVFIRPVLAYSTLGNFDDAILSSFFFYNEIELAELVFHELFHTIFFVKDEVDLNENLANYFSKEMVKIYFKDDKKVLEEYLKESIFFESKRDVLVDAAIQLEKKYSMEREKGNLVRDDYEKILARFNHDFIFEKLSSICKQNGIDKKECYDPDKPWNNASLAALLTYEKNKNSIDDLRKEKAESLPAFLVKIEEKYKDFLALRKKDKQWKEKGFEEFLFKK